MNVHDRPETYRGAFDGAAISKADREHLASLGNHPLVSVRRLLESFESLGFDGVHLDSRRGLQCGRTRTGRSTTAIT